MSTAEHIARIGAASPLVTVLGDFLLDEWWSGSIERIAREAPAPVVDVDERRAAPGGAANTALNAARLGARVRAVGSVGADAAGDHVRQALADAGVDVTRLRPVSEQHTITKVRVSAGDQLLLRVDETRPASWSEAALQVFLDDVREAGADADAQLICDYGSTLTDEIVQALAGMPRPAVRIVDAHDVRRWRATAPDVITPNGAETETLLGMSLGEGEARVEAARVNASAILEASGADAAIVTLDSSGAVLLDAGGQAHRTHAHPTPEKQASGAGDVFVAAFTVARAAGSTAVEAVQFAQQAADVAVRTPGTCTCSLEQLDAWASRTSGAALDADELFERLEEHRDAGARIVFTNGCFDVLHRGHTSYLRQARELGDVLVVAVNGDESVRRLKGPDRPVNPAGDRAQLLAELACVDYVTVFEEDTPRALIRRLRPDVYAKGGDYTPSMLPEAPDVAAVGGRIEILDYVSDHSTTQIIGRIRAAQRN
ncbi:D-glycero-beta-D-manno-heptose 1-phosphate adenylyltransferase [Actinomycetales bacterium SN12]|nr:D-glycero-beta-D-manno-heptose 1-phosphate adenylyltransferase [Actinomycetales bacterium SN12]